MIVMTEFFFNLQECLCFGVQKWETCNARHLHSQNITTAALVERPPRAETYDRKMPFAKIPDCCQEKGTKEEEEFISEFRIMENPIQTKIKRIS